MTRRAAVDDYRAQTVDLFTYQASLDLFTYQASLAGWRTDQGVFAVERKRAALWSALWTFGKHLPGCENRHLGPLSPSCTCGLERSLRLNTSTAKSQ